MPEGPEVWILSLAINAYYKNDNTFSYGKHLFLREEQQDWSFGLGGRVAINSETNDLEKRTDGYIVGEVNEYEGLIVGLGTDWITASLDELHNTIDFICKKYGKKQLGTILLDQKIIAGIGVAWGSEILFKARLNPTLRVSEQDLGNLAQVMFDVRNEIKDIYSAYLKEETDLKQFINFWFHNLYGIRRMQVYHQEETAVKVKVNGRNWWVHNDA